MSIKVDDKYNFLKENIFNEENIRSIPTNTLLQHCFDLKDDDRDNFMKKLLKSFQESYKISDDQFNIQNLPKYVERIENGNLISKSPEPDIENIVRDNDKDDHRMQYADFIYLYKELLGSNKEGEFFDLKIYEEHRLKDRKDFTNNLLNADMDADDVINNIDKPIYSLTYLYENTMFDVWEEHILLQDSNENNKMKINKLKYIPILYKKNNKTFILNLTREEFRKYKDDIKKIIENILYDAIKTFKNIILVTGIPALVDMKNQEYTIESTSVINIISSLKKNNQINQEFFSIINSLNQTNENNNIKSITSKEFNIKNYIKKMYIELIISFFLGIIIGIIIISFVEKISNLMKKKELEYNNIDLNKDK